MKRFLSFMIAIALLCTLILPSNAMENRVWVLERNMNAMKISVEQLERQFGLEQGDLAAVTFLQIPQNGQLISAGVEVAKGETLLRWELEELHYLADNTTTGDWFAIVPHCSQKLCAVVNIVK